MIMWFISFVKSWFSMELVLPISREDACRYNVRTYLEACIVREGHSLGLSDDKIYEAIMLHRALDLPVH